MSSPQPSDGSTAVDPDRLVRVLERHPVRIAVLYGSHARGTATDDSDVDVAVAFQEELSPPERLESRIDLVVDLVEALETDDVDVADLDRIRPAIGASALRTGVVLLGDREAVETYRERFERADAIGRQTHDDRMRRFDSILERLEGLV